MDTESSALRNTADENDGKGRWQAGAEGYKDKLVSQLKTMVTDGERLLKRVAESSSEGFATVRTQFDQQMDRTQDQLDKTRRAVSGMPGARPPQRAGTSKRTHCAR